MMLWPRPADSYAAVELLRREDVWHLSGYDGCLCAHLKILGFNIDVRCRKSTGVGKTEIAVTCAHMGAILEDCRVVASEVKRQILMHEPEAHVEIKVSIG